MTTGKKSPIVSCDLCNKNFSSPSKLRRHVRIVHEKIKPYHCQECGKNFGQKVNLIGHMQSRHKSIEGGDPGSNPAAKNSSKNNGTTILPQLQTTTSEGTNTSTIQEIEMNCEQNITNDLENHNNSIVSNSVPVSASFNAVVVESPLQSAPSVNVDNKQLTVNNSVRDSNKKVFKCMECVFDSEDSGDMISHHLSTHVQTMFNFDTSELLLE